MTETVPSPSPRPAPRSGFGKKLLFALLPAVLLLLLAETGFRLAGIGRPEKTPESTPPSQFERTRLEAPDGRTSEYRSGIHIGVPVRLNELDYRDWLYHEEEREGALRVVALGDSFTRGHGVLEERTWPRRLEALLRERAPEGARVRVLNFGRGGANTTDELEMLENDVLRFDPDLVVLGYTVFNDAETRRHVDRAVRDQRERKASPVYQVASRLKEGSWFVNWAVDRLRRPRNDQAMRAHVEKQYDPEAPGYRDSMRSLIGIAATLREKGIALIVVLFPVHHDDVALNDWTDYPFREVHERIRRTLDPFPEVLIVDVVEDFAPLLGEVVWVEGDRHPNARWHDLVATRLAEPVAERIGPGGE